jgi:transcriptional regulator with XRE-family HTH domain
MTTATVTFEELGRRLRTARLARGLTQEQLADQLADLGLDVAELTIGRYELARSRPPATLLPTLADILNVTLDDLLRPTPQG